MKTGCRIAGRLMGMGLLLLGMSGCSTLWDRTTDYTSRAVGAVGEKIHPVQVRKLGEAGGQPVLELRQRQNDVPRLVNWQMDHKARALCPKGYIREHAYAYQAGKRFAASEMDCAAGDCTHDLIWIVRCDDVPQEPFSIFGKY